MKERSTDDNIIKYFDKLCEKKSNDTDILKFEILTNDYLNIDKDPYVQLHKLIDYLRGIKPAKKQVILTKVEEIKQEVIKTEEESPIEQAVSTKEEEEETKIKESQPNRVLSESDRRAKRNLIKYNEALNKYSARIKEFENRELSLDDLDSDRSSYIIESKLKSRFNRINKEYIVYASKFPHLMQDDYLDESLEDVRVNISNIKSSMMAKKRVFVIKSKELTRYNDLNEKIQVYCKNLKEFPDYGDVSDLIEKSNDELGLGLNPEMCKNEAVSVFKQIGQMAKKKREQYDQDCFLTRFDESENLLNNLESNDPIGDNEQLKAVLVNNRKEADEKQAKLVDEFANKQINEGDCIDDGEEEEDEEEGEEEVISTITTVVDDNDQIVKKRRLSSSDIESDNEVTTTTTTTKLNLNEDIKLNLTKRLDRKISSSSSTASSSTRLSRSKKTINSTSIIDKEDENEIIILD